MSTEQNVFSRAAEALSKVESVAASSREIVETVKAAQTAVQAASQELNTRGTQMAERMDKAIREMQNLRSEVISVRAELNSAVERLRESEGRTEVEMGKQVGLLRSDARVYARSIGRVSWLVLIVWIIVAGACVFVLLSQFGVPRFLK